MRRFAFVSVCVLIPCPGLTWADDPASTLVQQLGHSTFDMREQANQRLLHIGPPAKLALLQGLRMADPEIRLRCERILFVVLEQDFKQRLDAFKADKDGKGDHDLPGLQRYRQLVGADATARDLYAEMAEAQRELLETATAAPKVVSDKYAAECSSLYQRLWYTPNSGPRRPITLGDVAALLFIGSDPDVSLTQNARLMTTNLLDQSAFAQSVRTGPRVETLRKLLGGWMQHTSGQSAARALNMAMQFNWKEGLDLSLRLIRTKDYASGMAIMAVGKLGAREHVPVLQALLDDNTVISTINFNNKPGTVEVRDAALAMMVHLTGQSIRDYGFEFFRGTDNSQVFFVPAYLAFADTEKREAAHKQWQDWTRKQPKP